MESNSPTITLKQKRDRYLELIADGNSEKSALEFSGLPKSTYLRLLLEDPDFTKQVEHARKFRAETYIDKISDSLGETRHLDKDAVPAEKLYFEKLQFLAKADNPDRYGGSGKGVNVNVNLGEFRMLPPEEAKKALAADPFAPIEAEFTTVPPESDEGLL